MLGCVGGVTGGVFGLVGGIAGRVTEVGDSFLQVEIAPNTVIAVQKQAVATVLPKGTLKSL